MEFGISDAHQTDILQAPNLDVEGVDGVGNGKGVSPSRADYGVWKSIVSFSSRFRGGALAEIESYTI